MNRLLMAVAVSTFAGVLSAEVEWPDDYKEKEAALIASWQPTGTQVGVSVGTLSGEDIMAGGRGYSAGYGSVERPFDVNWHTCGWDFFTGIFRSFPPTGSMLFVR